MSPRSRPPAMPNLYKTGLLLWNSELFFTQLDIVAQNLDPDNSKYAPSNFNSHLTDFSPRSTFTHTQ